MGQNEAESITTTAKLNPVQQVIYNTEKSFQKMTAVDGIAQAFSHYAAEDAVINRNNNLVKGKSNIFSFYDNQVYRNAKVDWEPEKIVVSDSNDLAFSHGQYHWQIPDQNGELQSYRGIYLTIWKKQDDGSWKYMWD